MGNKEQGNMPIAKYQAGQVIVSVWKNKQKTKDGKEYDAVSVSLQNRYKDGEDWKEAKSMRLNNVPKAISLLQRAYDESITRVKDDE